MVGREAGADWDPVSIAFPLFLPVAEPLFGAVVVLVVVVVAAFTF